MVKVAGEVRGVNMWSIFTGSAASTVSSSASQQQAAQQAMIQQQQAANNQLAGNLFGGTPGSIITTTGTPGQIQWTYPSYPNGTNDALSRLESDTEEPIITVFLDILKHIDATKREQFLKDLRPFIQLFQGTFRPYTEDSIPIILNKLHDKLEKLDYNKNFKEVLKDE